jgi:prophage antirepressor-like protein
MEYAEVTPVALVLARPAFDGHEMAVIEINGRQAWSARQVGSALGYEDARSVQTMIRAEWSTDLVDGTDYQVITGEELATVKDAAPELVSARAPSLMLLTESGVFLVAMLSRQPASQRLRRWLANEVLPSIRRTGGFGTVAAAPKLLPGPVGTMETLDRACSDLVRRNRDARHPEEHKHLGKAIMATVNAKAAMERFIEKEEQTKRDKLATKRFMDCCSLDNPRRTPFERLWGAYQVCVIWTRGAQKMRQAAFRRLMDMHYHTRGGKGYVVDLSWPEGEDPFGDMAAAE